MKLIPYVSIVLYNTLTFFYLSVHLLALKKRGKSAVLGESRRTAALEV